MIFVSRLRSGDLARAVVKATPPAALPAKSRAKLGMGISPAKADPLACLPRQNMAKVKCGSK
jgi:hypothetical protein